MRSGVEGKARARAQGVVGKSLVVLLGFGCAAASLADTVMDPSTEYLNRIKVAQTIQPDGEAPFGENFNLYSGGISFSQTDIQFPGVGPNITLSRSYSAGGASMDFTNSEAMADWRLSIPRISTIVTGNRAGLHGEWTVSDGFTNSYARCTQFGPVSVLPFTETSMSWWHGYELQTADGGSQPLMGRATENTLAPTIKDTAGNPMAFNIVTAGQWMISCLPSTANGAPGEAFLAVAPDGTKYWFNELVYGAAIETVVENVTTTSLTSGTGNSNGNGSGSANGNGPPADPGNPNNTGPGVYAGDAQIFIPRQMAYMYATRVEDRFGNSITYSYDGNGRPIGISASDGRQVGITWRTDAPLVASITLMPGTALARTWNYEYANVTDAGTRVLSRVVRPDNSAWTLSMANMSRVRVPSLFSNPSLPQCGLRTYNYTGGPSGSITITHPSGLIGQFDLTTIARARAAVPTVCYQMGSGTASSEATPPVYLSLAVTKKTLSGPGITTRAWQYTYSPARGSSASECTTSACVDWSWVEVKDPLNQITHYTHSTRWGYMEGKLLNVVTGVSTAGLDSPTGLQTETYQYAPPTQGPYPSRLGVTPDDGGIGATNNELAETQSPQSRHQLVRQGVTFTTDTTGFDGFANPARTVRSSVGNSGGDRSRTETTLYANDFAHWVISQPAAVTDVGTGKVISQTDYDPTTALPIATYKFGHQVASYQYYSDGTLSKIIDPLTHATTLAQYKRGVPQLITFADTKTLKATVNDLGEITSTTDQTPATTSYQYDALSRLTQITPPAGGGVTWNPTLRTFVAVATTEYGIAAGHWRLTESTGTGQTTTYYDAFWRPLLTLAQDTGSPGTSSFTVHRYDELGRESFVSYPVASLSNVTQTLDGTRTFYDVLNRPARVEQDTELTPKIQATAYTYLSGFRTQVTNPRQYSTTTAYEVFDQPATDWPVSLSQPEGLTTTINRDTFGKPLVITRSGTSGGVSASSTRSYVYDDFERLCKMILPESGATISMYDAADRVMWHAEGQPYTSTSPSSCDTDRNAVTDADKVLHGYDLVNRLLYLDYAAGTDDINYTYENDGKLKTISTAGNTWTYSYNPRRLLTGESLLLDGTTYPITYGYNANGHVTSIKYPDLASVAISVNGLGQQTAITGYATAIKYFPNGAIKQFNYGNGVAHTLTQNTRQLPLRVRDANSAGVVVDDTYAYDANGNVLDITDQAQAGLTTRGMSYDGLDRLSTAVAPNEWGNASWTYDVLDNMRAANQGTRQYRYVYDTTQRLSKLTDPNGATVLAFGYNAAGDETARGGQAYTFDKAHRLLAVPAIASYVYDGNGRRVKETKASGASEIGIYNQAGQKLFYKSGTTTIRYIYLNNSLLALTNVANGVASPNVYLHTDALGSVVAKTSSTGAITKRNAYTAYGETYGSTLDGLGYTGHEMDQDTGLTYMQQRYYDPVVGRFISVDPSLVDGVMAANFNRYYYANNNPYRFADPDGRDGVPIAFPDYKISVGPFKVSGLGHAGVLLIDNRTGRTRYFEYGRYDKANRGIVRTFPVPNVVMGKDGKPTAESMQNVLSQISDKAGHGGRIDGAYVKNDDFAKMEKYAENRMALNSDKTRTEYSLTSNNCATFATATIAAGEPGFNSASAKPNDAVKDWQNGHDKVSYEPPKKDDN